MDQVFDREMLPSLLQQSLRRDQKMDAQVWMYLFISKSIIDPLVVEYGPRMMPTAEEQLSILFCQ
ncbi:MAG TPA: hypothetical protein VE643_05570 [Nitrososphaeraceae archaeon]|nr:hypothetical protein [Nitrososphaeraceae archaeon]